tara:strand:- start:832 stop:1278 length:447 start_codon:yes stop_codon:yes gene_type:complete
MRVKIIIIACFFTLFSNVSFANQEYFVMLKNKKVNVRYGPSFDYPIKYIYKKKLLPLKVIDKKENFRRIIDLKNNSGWIHLSQLKDSKSLITTSQKILFKKATKFSEPLVKLDKGRLLVLKKCKPKWCQVKTGDYTGWVDKTNLWGFN